jgi:hypothetical protein
MDLKDAIGFKRDQINEIYQIHKAIKKTSDEVQTIHQRDL